MALLETLPVGRFELQEVAGCGGMGVVFRAVDQQTGAAVAVKRLSRPDAPSIARFLQEARVLAELAHPHVVRYVTHGLTDAGEPYLAMEWLDGEALDARLARGALRIDESVALARRVASALAAAHARGVVHRDVKPSNIFLPGGSIEEVKLLDFGIARWVEATEILTQTGSLMGTPGYLAPEQARSDRESIGPRADVFSLGCVLFECLTGKPAFVGAHVMSLLAKLLIEDPPRVRQLQPAVPEALDALVARMLAKDPAARPEDGAAVLAALDELPEHVAGTPLSRPAPIEGRPEPASITAAETRLVSVAALVPAAGRMHGAPGAEPGALLAAIRRALTPFCARVEQLANGVIVAVLVGAGNPRDRAALAARCALRMQLRAPDAHVALLTGRSEATRPPIGDVLERAAAALERPLSTVAEGRFGPIQIDEMTRALLDERFEVAEEGGALELRGERETGGEPRTLLGRPSQYLGRERELRRLVGVVEESVEDRRALAVLVTAPPGVGKSRLRYELLRELRRQHPEVVVAVGRADSIGAGSAFAMLGSALRGALSIEPGEAAAQRARLSHVASLFSGPGEAGRVAEFLGEIVGVPFPDDDSPRLRAARQNPRIMADRTEEAFLDLVRGITDRWPAMLVFEDLHWGDAPSIQLVDAVLRELHDRPVVVLAFARPEVHELFPKLWADRAAIELRLGPLPPRAAEALARSALGEGVDPATIAAIVARADGNAFYLEELIRAVASGQGAALPETVAGMVEARLESLDPEARRLLRAGSIFGEVLCKGETSSRCRSAGSPRLVRPARGAARPRGGASPGRVRAGGGRTDATPGSSCCAEYPNPYIPSAEYTVPGDGPAAPPRGALPAYRPPRGGLCRFSASWGHSMTKSHPALRAPLPARLPAPPRHGAQGPAPPSPNLRPPGGGGSRSRRSGAALTPTGWITIPPQGGSEVGRR